MTLTEIEQQFIEAIKTGQTAYHEWAEQHGRKLLAVAKAAKENLYAQSEFGKKEKVLEIALRELEE